MISLALVLGFAVAAGSARAADPALMLHNSTTTGSAKWGGDWGTATGRYGQFTCETCHAFDTTNIKRIRQTITAPNSPTHDFPGTNVTFLLSEEGNSDFGDDSSAHATSTKICEVCHSATSYHNYNQGSATTHFNQSDCMSCHKHQRGFRPVGTACHQCHGNAPSTGAHALHTRVVSNDKDAEDRSDCALCHTGANLYTYDPVDDMGNGRNHSSAPGRKTLLNASVGYNDADKTCANACHKSSAGDGAWDDADGLNCDACHYYAAAPTSAGNNGQPAPYKLSSAHNKHFDKNYGCATCHGTLDTQGSGHLNHKTAKNSSTDALWLQSQGKGYLNPGGTDVDVVVATWTNSAVTNDGGNSCANAQCHNPSPGASFSADWDTDTSSTCYFCHGYNNTMFPEIPQVLSGSHDAHMKSSTLYGRSAGCPSCHSSGALTHMDGNVTLHASLEAEYSGTLSEFGSASWGGCGTNLCHNNGKGGAPLVTDYVWGTPRAETCTLCHAQSPTSGAHSTHLAATAYGPNPAGTTDCSQCHTANANNTSMAGKASHLNSSVNFDDPPKFISAGTIASNTTVTACSNCHGGLTAANAVGGAKKNWASAARLACETCHGDYSAANSKADGSGVAAPLRATNYDSKGHGQAGIAKACGDCHETATAHISGALDDANRVKSISSKNFDTAGQENDWCNGCHAAPMPVHYGNSQTADGASADGLYCHQCHDPHGNSGYDAMVAGTIQGRSVASFTDRSDRAQYYNDNGASDNSGVCQACHDSEVSYFNRSDTPPAHYAGNCISCHSHDDSEAFKPSGCSGCHGDASAGNFWPDSSPAAAYQDRLGSHEIHVNRIGDWIADSVDGTEGSATLAAKNATCVYCHPDPGGSNRDGSGHDSNTIGSATSLSDMYNDGVNLLTDDGGNAKFRFIQTGALDPDGSFNPAIKRCSNIDCHSNGDYTWTWYEDAVAPGAIADLAAVTGSTTGTVKLTWTPPDNDGGTGPVSYGYEVRYRTGGPIDASNWASSTIAGGPPPAKRNYGSEIQEMTVYGLDPGTTYHFAVKTFDELFAGGVPVNFSTVSNSASAAAKTDTTAPVFLGIDGCAPAFADGAVNLSWIPARDEADAITYRIWVVENGAVDFSTAPDYSIAAPATHFQVTGLTNGNNYYFGVRAEDQYGNRDSNTKQKEAIPQLPNEKEWMGRIYYTDHAGVGCDTRTSYGGSTQSGTMSTSGYTCGADVRTELNSVTVNSTSTPVLQWTAASSYSSAVNINGGSFMIWVRERDENIDQQIRIALGHDGSGWTQLGSIDKTISAGYRGSIAVSLASVTGQVPAGRKLVIRVYKIAGGSERLIFRFGSERYRSMLTVYEQVANSRPNAFTVNTPSPGVPAGDVAISWAAASDPDGDTIHYDVYGSVDGGVSYPYIIAEDVTGTSATWQTNDSGIILASGTARIKVEAGDGLAHSESGTLYSHRDAFSGTFTIDNTVDGEDPAAVTDLTAEHRPKTGTVWLYWSAPGDDGLVGRASQYDIRYKLADINGDGDESDTDEGPIDTSAKWSAANTVIGEPVPTEPTYRQGYEVLGLQPGVKYYFALKTADEAGRWSALSNSPFADGGLRCGTCHSTPPDDSATKGTHESHGFTQTDCTKCHGAESDTFATSHSDGVTKLAWNNPKVGYTNTAAGPDTLTDGNVVYNDGAINIYTDSDGGGGFNDVNQDGGTDSGTCSGFNGSGVTGCHGTGTPVWNSPASVNCAMCHGDPGRGDKDPYGRTFENTDTDDGYRIDYSGATPLYRAAPGIDMRGMSGDAEYSAGSERYAVGQHLRHLNFSSRLTGDQCDLCHLDGEHADGTMDVKLDPAAGEGAYYVDGVDGANPGTCMGTNEIRCHGDNADPPTWETRTPYLTGSKLIYCSECHGHQDNVYWQGASKATADAGHSATVNGTQNGDGVDTTLTVQSGHTMVAGDRIMKGDTYFKIQSVTSTVLTLHKPMPVGVKFTNGEVVRTKHIPHTIDGGVVRACTWCHVEGHPQGDETTAGTNPPGEETVFIPNYTISGIDYSSGGIHLRQVINGRTTMNDGSTVDTEAEICWACHEDNGISEWGTNTDANTGNSPYHYGSLNQTGWISDAGGTATWSSYNFPYKNAALQSTHSGNGNPSQTPAGPGVDPVEIIRCTYCHDVHDMNQAIDDEVSGAPYLRGTWMGNPYKEDGAPGRYDANHNGTATYTENPFNYYTYLQDFGPVPRGNSGAQNKMGGYWIDQNSGYPTASWTLKGSAGLCTLCHGSDVNNMNKFGTASDDWIGTNGHSNAAIGGSGTYKINLFNPEDRGSNGSTTAPHMAYQASAIYDAGDSAMYGLRNAGGTSATEDLGNITADDNEGVYPYAWNTSEGKTRLVYGEFTWGVDFTTTSDTGGDSALAAEMSYHRFSCSKCHNPHASRLPRLMITNCLDVAKNKWDNIFASNKVYTSGNAGGDPDWTSGTRDGININWSTQPVMPYTGNDPSGDPRNKQFAYATSAQNCHRYVDLNGDGDGLDTGEEKGWNKVTPWVETNSDFLNN